ncbi:MAG: GTP-dependent dephospho-CoA kinase family protein [Candidatus Thermoplasmatota archaeon]
MVKAKTIAVVGDIATLEVYRNGIAPKLAIVDFKSKRKSSEKLKSEISKISCKVTKVKNPAGTITSELWNAVEEAYRDAENTRIEISGEEDLASLACIALAPENTLVLYGLPEKGLVVVEVTTKEKKLVNEVLKKMECE